MLTIKDLSSGDAGSLVRPLSTQKPHSLTIKNEEGETRYGFKLAFEQSPPPSPSSLAPPPPPPPPPPTSTTGNVI